MTITIHCIWQIPQREGVAHTQYDDDTPQMVNATVRWQWQWLRYKNDTTATRQCHDLCQLPWCNRFRLDNSGKSQLPCHLHPWLLGWWWWHPSTMQWLPPPLDWQRRWHIHHSATTSVMPYSLVACALSTTTLHLAPHLSPTCASPIALSCPLHT